MAQFYTTDFFVEVAKGHIPGHSLMAKFGENPDIPTGGAFEDIWDGGGTYVPPAAAVAHNVTSTLAGDAGTVLSSGTATGGSLTTLVDSSATFSTDTVAVGDAILNDSNVQIAAVTAVTSETTLACLGSMRSPNSGLFGKANAAGDSYRIVTDASTGASILHIAGLNASFLDQEEFVVLNGGSDVATSGLYIRQHRARVFGAVTGTRRGAVGTVTSTTDDVAATVSCQIIAGNNQTLMAIYTVPANKTGFILNWWGSMSRAVASAVSDFHLRGGPLDDLQYLLQTRSVTTTGKSDFDYNYRIPIAIPGGSDIWAEANSNANLVGVSSGFDILLVEEGA